MDGILTIATRELKRLRSRFQGGSRITALILILGTLGVSYLVAQSGFVPSSGIYTIGAAPAAPPIEDSRFDVIPVELADGYALLNAGTLDAFVDQEQLVAGRHPKSPYAVGALQEYLETKELARLASEEDLDRAFPLRLAIERITTTQTLPVDEGTLTDLIRGGDGRASSGDEAGADGGLIDLAVPPGSSSAADLREQFDRLQHDSRLPRADFAFVSSDTTLIPSLMQPPIPFAQVIVAFLYVLPIAFVSVFFTSSFMDEKKDRRISVLLSAPVTPGQIILGKLLPYIVFSMGSVAAITLVLGGNLPLSMAIFTPVILFIFAVYLIVPLVYRTFKDTTFISLLATSAIISYLVFPAMLSGVNDLAYISPLTLAVRMYRGEPFGLRQYLFSTVPMYLIFALALHVGTRVLNEEYLMGFRPLYRKAADAVYLSMWHQHPYLSVALLSASLVPIVYALELVMLAVSLNLPLRHALVALLAGAVVVEEVAKSFGIVVLLERGRMQRWTQILGLSFLSATGFLVAEKLLLLLSLSIVTQSPLSGILFSSGMLVIPLLAHFAFTALVCTLRGRLGVRYIWALAAGSVAHALYNLVVLQQVL